MTDLSHSERRTRGHPEKKIPCCVALTPRQVNTLTAEGERVGISWTEQLREVLNDWIRRQAGSVIVD